MWDEKWGVHFARQYGSFSKGQIHSFQHVTGNSTARKTKTCPHTDVSANIPNSNRKGEKPNIHRPLNTWTDTVYTVSYHLALTSCTAGGPIQTSLVEDSRSQRACAWLYLHGISKEGKSVGKWGIRGCLGLELGLGVPANEQGPLGRRKAVKIDMVTIIQVVANTLRFTALCISSECIVCPTSYTQWSYLKRDGLKNGVGWPAEQTGWHSPDVLIGGSRSHVSGAYCTIISTLLDIWKFL